MKIKQMKKPIIFLLMLIGVNTSIFSLTSESWLRFGFEFGNFFERYAEQERTIESFTGSIGLNFGGYRFFNNKNYGIFIHGFFAVSIINSTTVNDVIISRNFENYSSVPLLVGMIIGPGFRYNLSEKLTLNYAVGINWLLSLYMYDEYFPAYGDVTYDATQMDFGIGGDVGIKLELSGTVFLSIGSIITFDFLRSKYVEASFRGTSSGVVKDFFMFGIRPYISVGFNISAEY